MKPIVQQKTVKHEGKKPKKEEKVKPKIEKKYVQTKGFFGSENVDKVTRGSSGGWNDGASGSGGGGGGQMRRPSVKMQKPSTKEEVLIHPESS